MTAPEAARATRVPLSRSQRNLYNGVLQDNDPGLYLIGKTYRFHRFGLPEFLTALEAAILKNLVQLCVLEFQPTEMDYPDLVARLRPHDIVRVRPHDVQAGCAADELTRSWESGILAKPLVRYTVRTDEAGYVSGLEVFSHHILLDGGATGIIEADLARHLTAGAVESPCLTGGLVRLGTAHRREAARVEEALRRLGDALQRELADDAGHHGVGLDSNGPSGPAAKGVLHESIRIDGRAYGTILALSEARQVPLNVLVATAALAVHAGLRKTTESLLVHAVDNRFGDPDLDVATCLVNSVAHSVRFPSFASVKDVVAMVDRGYVKAVRRRWLREEHYRRMYLAINRTPHVEALTLNFIREPCAPELREFLSEPPAATHIGPVEGMTVAGVLDEVRQTLDIAIWDRADLPTSATRRNVAKRIAAVLESMATLWHQPIAMAVDEWFSIGADGTCCQGDSMHPTQALPASAWFLNPAGAVRLFLERRRYVSSWIGRLVQDGVALGDVVVFTDDNTDKAVDLAIACHLAGCGYSVCDTSDEVPVRVDAIAAHCEGVSPHAVDVTAARIKADPDERLRELIDRRVEQVARDALLAARTAYIMPTSGSTGQPKLVRITHGSLALFCDAARRNYGWGAHDRILQCAPLTSDISVEEIFGSATCGSELIRSAATRTGDLAALARDLVTNGATVVDLPTALWHLLCEDADAMDVLRGARLRQVVIGGEAVRPGAVEKWIYSVATQGISLVSSYGPTETTVVVTCLPIGGATAAGGGAQHRLGRPLVPNTVFIAFGEVVIVGDLVSAGYLGIDGRAFGSVILADGQPRRAFGTADRVIVDDEGFPVLSGRKDAIVKVSGKRVDTAEITRRITEDPAVSDVAVELHRGSLGVWFQTQRTRGGGDDTVAATRIRLILVRSGVSSSFVAGVPVIPRKPNGKVDTDRLRTMPQSVAAARGDADLDKRAVRLAAAWSGRLRRAIRPDSSLLGEGIGSLDLIKILPETRAHLGRHVTLLDLISADSAANLFLAGATASVDGWRDADTAAEIASDLASLSRRRPARGAGIKQSPNGSGDQTIVVLGASGILGTGFAQAVLDLKRSGGLPPDVVLVTRATLPETDPWTSLRDVDGVRVEELPAALGPTELDALLRDTGAGTVVNCIGNTNVVVPYRQLRSANVELVSIITQTCAAHGARLVHLSTSVVNADVSAPRVVDPREGPYPYAASKSLAELAVAGSPRGLDFTIVRLPRVLGTEHQLRDSNDILVSFLNACVALRAYPSLTLTEEVTTGRAAAEALVKQMMQPVELGRGITVVRGEPVTYAELLREYALDELDVTEWKCRLDQSGWARMNPRRWSVIDAWITLGMRLGARSYADYLADYPTIALEIERVAEVVAKPRSIRAHLRQDVPSH
ncbi:AMP-binding protein [Mycobacterium sp. 050134]|uniref:AMP-binding protein n=1 Tax=Mycobacterium sp. 050134 TaxID=3096111 RepID=UPI002ED9C980